MRVKALYKRYPLFIDFVLDFYTLTLSKTQFCQFCNLLHHCGFPQQINMFARTHPQGKVGIAISPITIVTYRYIKPPQADQILVQIKH